MGDLFCSYELSKTILSLGGTFFHEFWFYVDGELTADMGKILDQNNKIVANIVPAYRLREISSTIKCLIDENLSPDDAAKYLIELLLTIKK
jgi:hypothetical protein